MKKLIVAALITGSLVIGTAAPALADWDDKVRVAIWDVQHKVEEECEYGNDGYLDYCNYVTYKRYTLGARNKVGFRIDVRCKIYFRNKSGKVIDKQWVDFGEIRRYDTKLRRTEWMSNKVRRLTYWCYAWRVRA